MKFKNATDAPSSHTELEGFNMQGGGQVKYNELDDKVRRTQVWVIEGQETEQRE